MSVITMKSNRKSAPAATNQVPSKVWLNIGLNMTDPDTGETRFVRLPLGIPVESLEPRKIYDTTNPEFAAEITVINTMIEQLQARGEVLDEGEAVDLKNIAIQLYRRKEEMTGNDLPMEAPELDIFAK